MGELDVVIRGVIRDSGTALGSRLRFPVLGLVAFGGRVSGGKKSGKKEKFRKEDLVILGKSEKI